MCVLCMLPSSGKPCNPQLKHQTAVALPLGAPHSTPKSPLHGSRFPSPSCTPTHLQISGLSSFNFCINAARLSATIGMVSLALLLSVLPGCTCCQIPPQCPTLPPSQVPPPSISRTPDTHLQISGLSNFNFCMKAARLSAIIGTVSLALLLSVLPPVRMLSKITTTRVAANAFNSCSSNSSSSSGSGGDRCPEQMLG